MARRYLGDGSPARGPDEEEIGEPLDDYTNAKDKDISCSTAIRNSLRSFRGLIAAFVFVFFLIIIGVVPVAPSDSAVADGMYQPPPRPRIIALQNSPAPIGTTVRPTEVVPSLLLPFIPSQITAPAFGALQAAVEALRDKLSLAPLYQEQRTEPAHAAAPQTRHVVAAAAPADDVSVHGKYGAHVAGGQQSSATSGGDDQSSATSGGDDLGWLPPLPPASAVVTAGKSQSIQAKVVLPHGAPMQSYYQQYQSHNRYFTEAGWLKSLPPDARARATGSDSPSGQYSDLDLKWKAPPPADPGSDGDQIAKERAELVKDAFRHSWKAYKKYAWGMDELCPVTRVGKNWGRTSDSGLGLTILDGLSTMILMGLEEETQEALGWIKNSLDFDKDVVVSQFECTIRHVAGLISAFELLGEKDEHRFLIVQAVSLAQRLLFAYNTTSGIPSAQVHLGKRSASSPGWVGGSSVLSEFGSLQLEFRALSFHTKNPIYAQKVNHIMDIIEAHLPANGLVPTFYNPSTGHFVNDHVSLGALGDSYYEYLLKQWLLTNRTETRYRKMYELTADSIIRELVQHSSPGNQLFLAEKRRGIIFQKMDHLACFAGGMFIMGAHKLGLDEQNFRRHFDTAMGIGETCHDMYVKTKTGISPEVTNFLGGRDGSSGAAFALLRPEAVETFFYNWRYTKDWRWREYSWQVFQSWQKWGRLAEGYSGLKNVNIIPPVKDDLQQSFWLAETLKYFFLIFADDSVLDLNKWVFNTEAHPLRVRSLPSQWIHRGKEGEEDFVANWEERMAEYSLHEAQRWNAAKEAQLRTVTTADHGFIHSPDYRTRNREQRNVRPPIAHVQRDSRDH